MRNLYAEYAFMQSEYAVNVTDLHGSLLAVNEAYLRLYGFASAEEVLGFNQRLIRSPKTPKERYAEMWKVIADNKIWRGELVNRRTSGEDIYVYLTIYPIFENGVKVAYMGFTFDRTQQVELEKQLAHSNRLAVLGEIGAGLAHELNNPLTSISLEAENLQDLLAERHIDRQQSARALSSILNGVDRMKRVIEHLLLYVRKEEKQPEICEVSDLVKDCMLFLDRQLRSREIAVDIRVPNGLLLAVSRTDMESVLHNLMTNARDALEQWQGSKSIHIHAREIEANWVEILFEDSGPGIPEELRENIFEPFFTTKIDGKGTGLGLSISRKIVKEHGGELSYAKGPLGGAMFRLLMPMAEISQMDQFREAMDDLIG